MTEDQSKLVMDGLWNNNPALVQLLGLCPLLAVTGSVVNALGLGFATLVVLVGSNLLISLIRNKVADDIRLPVFVMIIAALVTITELTMQALTYELYQVLGIFIPLIVTNCAILGRADAYARKHPPHMAVLDGLSMGLGFATVLVLLGAMRELLGQGTLFADMHLLLGPMAQNWTLVIIDNYRGFLFAVLPPGAFVGMGLIIAAKNTYDQYQTNKKLTSQPQIDVGSKRVRVTGTIA